MPIHLRPASPADTPLILSLIRELAAYEREPNSVVATEALLKQHLFGERPSAECVIAELHGTPKGFALFFHNFSTWRGQPGLYLEDLFVRPDVRGSGLGRAMLVHLARLAVERGCARMEWAVLDWNEPAVGFYRALGAQPMNEWTTWRLTGAPLERLAGNDY